MWVIYSSSLKKMLLDDGQQQIKILFRSIFAKALIRYSNR